MVRKPQECWEKAEMLLELKMAIREINYYIESTPPKYDIAHWIDVRKRLRDRCAALEEFIFNGELDTETWYSDENIRKEMIDYLTIQGAFRYDNNH